MNELLDAALSYASRGWPVFPCQPCGKAPAIPSPHPEGSRERETCSGGCGLDGHGCNDATTDPDVIRAWWRPRPMRNVAIATGHPAPDVLDVDVTPAGSGFAAFNRLKQAGLLTGALALVKTRSGGLHVYFAGTAQGCSKLPRHHLDFKAAGGYVIAPPSYVDADSRGPGGHYQLLDEREATGRLDWQAVRRILDPPRPVPPRPRAGTGTAGLAAWVAEQAEGNRNDGLFWAACRIAEAGGDPAELVGAAVQAGLTELEARRTVASAERTVSR